MATDSIARGLAADARAHTSALAIAVSSRAADYGVAVKTLYWVNPAKPGMITGGVKAAEILSPDPALASWINYETANQPAVNSGRLEFGGGASALYQSAPYTPVGVSSLPDASGGPGAGNGGGFTCTGLARFSDGSWLLGNHGWTNENDGPIVLAASLVHVSADFSTKLHETLGTTVDASYTGSLQGVAIDTDDTIWFCSPQYGRVFHVHSHLSGTFGQLIGSFALALANGIAVDTVANALVIVTNGNSSSVDKVALWYNRDGTLTGKSLGLPVNAIPDQLFFDPTWSTEGALWVTSGDNHRPGRVTMMDMATKTPLYQWHIREAGAVEGIHVTRSGGDVTIRLANDGYFHNTYPMRNVVYTISASIDAAMLARTKLTGVIVMRARAQASGVVPIFMMGNAFSGGRGYSVNLTATNNQIRFRLCGPGNANTIDRDAASGIDITAAPFVLVWELDITAQTLRVYINGNKNPVATYATLGVGGTVCQIAAQIAGTLAGGTGASFDLYYLKMIDTISFEARRALEGEAAWASGQQALLPAGHDFATFLPPSLRV